MMRNNPRRASGLKALQAIKENSQSHKNKRAETSRSENPHSQGGKKRTSSPTVSIFAPRAKRNALGDVTNNKQGPKVAIVKPIVTSSTETAKPTQPPRSSTHQSHNPTPLASVPELDESAEASQVSSLGSASQDTPVTAMQNVLQATTLSDESLRSEESPVIVVELSSGDVIDLTSPTPSWTDIDQADAHDPSYSSEYAPEIYSYMMQREMQFLIQPYMHMQKDISAMMRTILIDWLIDVQENFELFHETLYLGVRLVDMYLSQREVTREFLQLVGATCLLIASKFEELSPPLVADFLYLCDDAYNAEQMLAMEREILAVLGYDINAPVAYRFLRRLARAASASMETHTMARYIAEHSLHEYEFVDVRPSLVAAASMYLALRMKKLGGWTPTLKHYSGYSVDEMLPLVERLNNMLKAPLIQHHTVRNKYSHEVFFKVAQAPPLSDVRADATAANSA